MHIMPFAIGIINIRHKLWSQKILSTSVVTEGILLSPKSIAPPSFSSPRARMSVILAKAGLLRFDALDPATKSVDKIFSCV